MLILIEASNLEHISIRKEIRTYKKQLEGLAMLNYVEQRPSMQEANGLNVDFFY
jgi:hypothetical protein